MQFLSLCTILVLDVIMFLNFTYLQTYVVK